MGVHIAADRKQCTVNEKQAPCVALSGDVDINSVSESARGRLSCKTLLPDARLLWSGISAGATIIESNIHRYWHLSRLSRELPFYQWPVCAPVYLIAHLQVTTDGSPGDSGWLAAGGPNIDAPDGACLGRRCTPRPGVQGSGVQAAKERRVWPAVVVGQLTSRQLYLPSSLSSRGGG